MRNSRRFVALLALVTCFVMTFSNQAFAAGSFTWNVTMTHAVKSRTWSTSKSGDITIKSNVPCWSTKVKTYTIELVKENRLGDTYYGKVSYTCGSTQVFTWTGKPKDEYHFDIEKATDGIEVKGSGSVSYV